MAIHPSHPVPLAAKPVISSPKILPSSDTTRAAAPSAVAAASSSHSFPSSSSPSDGPSLTVRHPSSATPPPLQPPPPTATLPQSYTTQLSDLLLSAVVPGIPKTKGKGAGGSKLVDAEGRRLLSSKKEELNLTSTTQNFRKFVLKVGWLFTIQDHVEQLIFWHRPSHSILFLLSWTILSFKPHLLLLLPPLIILAFLLQPYNLPPLNVTLPQHRATPVWEDEDGEATSDEDAGSRERRMSSPTRNGGSVGRSFSISGSSGDRVKSAGKVEGPTLAQTHAIEERKIEANLSSVYYQNIQGIQNLMGTFSDVHDTLASPLTTLFSPIHPLHQTFVAGSLVALLALSYFASSIPSWVVLLPVGWGPLLIGLIPPATPLPPFPPPQLAPHLHTLHLLLLNDRIPSHLLSHERREIFVWETQRFSTAAAGGGSVEGWGESTWGGREVGSTIGGGQVHGLNELALEPREEWDWLPGEEWCVDRVGGWADSQVDSDGWSHLSPNHQPYPPQTPIGEEGSARRRRWWRRGVRV